MKPITQSPEHEGSSLAPTSRSSRKLLCRTYSIAPSKCTLKRCGSSSNNRASQFSVSQHNGHPTRTSSSPGVTRAYSQGHNHGQSQASVPKTQVYYAIVQHDFVAERPDELEAKRGDAITVVAQSNREWFVAKPIGKLGRPGLIPVSFVLIHDPATGEPVEDVNALIDRGDLPKVEEWKRAMLSYKQNSISLGVIDEPPSRGSVSNSPYVSQQEPQQPDPEPTRPPTPEMLPEGILLSADVVSFHYEMEEYWFRVDATFQPYPAPGQTRLPPSKHLILFRIYNDFYDFQVSLLNTFPREAGRQPPHPRTLPFMPGPAKDVDDALTATRREELDEYVHALCALGRSGGRYILEHTIVRQFLSLKPGDVENETEPRVREIEALNAGDGYAAENGDQYSPTADYGEEVNDQMARLNVNDGRRSAGSDYDDDGYQQYPVDRHPYQQYNGAQALSRDESLRLQARSQNHSRAGSSTSFHTQRSQNNVSYPYDRSHSPADRTVSPTNSRNSEHVNGQSSRRIDNMGYQQSSATPSTNSFRRSDSPGRSRSQSTTNNFNNPPISSVNPQTAFVKIKIFDRVADDLIAIRVHPKVSHYELMEKVQSRLGSEIAVLKYRDSLTNTFVGLDSDAELRAWMDGTDKHVLYAD